MKFVNFLKIWLIFNISIGGSRTAAASKMELFVIILNYFQPLTIITKCFILDVAAVLDPPHIVLFLNACKQTFYIPHMRISQKGKGVLM